MTTNVAVVHEPVMAQEIKPAVVVKTVMIVDDELVGLSYSHLPKTVKDLFEDRTSPEFAELWGLVMHLKGFADLATEDTDKVRQFVASDAIVQEVILSGHFQASATELLKKPLTTFLERANAILELRCHLETAFSAPEYKTEFAAARPSVPAELLKYDLLILDLVLQNSAGAVDEIVKYLAALGKDAYPTKLPCIIVMSNRQELIDERIRFSNESNISAAGLLILPKNEVAKENFGAPGLILSYQQLDRQREVAQQMRVFMHTWIAALEQARNKAGAALWNLDAAAMQEIHLVAHLDNDPYDEHLNALISREYLWHVESDPTVATAVEALDGCFQAQFKENTQPAVIRQRFIAPFVQPEHGRKLVSHFTWTGFPVPAELSTFSTEEAVKKFSKLVPFGALLAPKTLTPDTECLIHITQQCDLNQNQNLKKAGQSAQFTVVLPVEVHDYKIPSHDTDELVARGLRIGGKEYDFKLAKGRQLALPIAKFIAHAAEEKLSVIGRLRHDIATHFLLATANHMTRWASQKVNHVEVKEVALHLHGQKFATGKSTFIDPDTSDPMTVQVAMSNKLFYFQDDTSMRVALWVAQELKTHYQLDVDLAAVCNQLSVGLHNKACLVKIVSLKVDGIKAENLAARLSAENAPKDTINLMVVYDPDAIA